MCPCVCGGDVFVFVCGGVDCCCFSRLFFGFDVDVIFFLLFLFLRRYDFIYFFVV